MAVPTTGQRWPPKVIEISQNQISVTPGSGSVNEGGVASFSVATSPVVANTPFAWRLTGVTGGDIVGGVLNGVGTTDANGLATLTFNIAADQTTEGPETLGLQVGLYGGSASMTINDTSTTGMTWALGVANITYSNNNKTATSANQSEKSVMAANEFKKSTGKWYTEITVGINSGSVDDEFFGLVDNTSAFPGQTGSGGFGTTSGRTMWTGGISANQSGTTPALPNGGFVAMIAIDFDAKQLWTGHNGTWHLSGDPATGTNPRVWAWSGTLSLAPACRLYYTGNTAEVSGEALYALPSGFQLWAG